MGEAIVLIRDELNKLLDQHVAEGNSPHSFLERYKSLCPKGIDKYAQELIPILVDIKVSKMGLDRQSQEKTQIE